MTNPPKSKRYIYTYYWSKLKFGNILVTSTFRSAQDVPPCVDASKVPLYSYYTIKEYY
jgi:hypothetical protein